MTKILPHHNCFNGEHVFIPNQTVTNTRQTWIESFVCTNCLVVVKKNEWEIHQQELARIAQGLAPMELEDAALKSIPAPPVYIPHDYKEPIAAAAKPAAKPATKAAPKKA